MSKLLALIDGSVYSESVCDHAAWFAGRSGASVDLLHVLGRREVSSDNSNLSGSIGLGARTALLEELAELDAQKAKLAQKRGRAILDGAKARLEAAGLGEIRAKLRTDGIVEAVQAFEADVDCIVIGKRGEAADFAKLHLGSNLERIARACQKPLLVASRAFKPIERILVAYDGGTSANKAVDGLISQKAFAGLSVHLLMVGKKTDQASKHLAAAAERLRGHGFTAEYDFEEGQPDQVIAARVERDPIDLLAMGAYGHSRLRNLIIGSTTTEMVRSCLVPVMLFR